MKNFSKLLIIATLAITFSCTDDEEETVSNNTDTNSGGISFYALDVTGGGTDSFDSEVQACYTNATFRVDISGPGDYSQSQNVTIETEKNVAEFDFTFSNFTTAGTGTVNCYLEDELLETKTFELSEFELENDGDDEVRFFFSASEYDCSSFSNSDYTLDVNVESSDSFDDAIGDCIDFGSYLLQIYVYNVDGSYEETKDISITLGNSISEFATFMNFPTPGDYTAEVYIDGIFIDSGTENISELDLRNGDDEEVNITITASEVGC
ncbi:MAG: hypothetical protein HRT61_15225 [Ekhidna sp.]|nr:hypothetical protein [Ekhidna sp.]